MWSVVGESLSASPEVADDDDGHQQGAEGHGVADSVHDVEPLKEVLLWRQREGREWFSAHLVIQEED